MKISILGSTGCVGSYILESLDKDSQISKIYASKNNTLPKIHSEKIEYVKVDLTDIKSIKEFISDSTVLIYLIHSLAKANYKDIDLNYAKNVATALKKTKVRKIIYVGGISDSTSTLSNHLLSRNQVYETLKKSDKSVIHLRGGLFLAKCSSSYIILKNVVNRFSFLPLSTSFNNKTSYFTPKILVKTVNDCIYKTVPTQIDLVAKNLTYKELIANIAVKENKHIVFLGGFPLFLIKFGYLFLINNNWRLAFQLLESTKVNTNSNSQTT